jgi:hypothetical protein
MVLHLLEGIFCQVAKLVGISELKSMTAAAQLLVGSPMPHIF